MLLTIFRLQYHWLIFGIIKNSKKRLTVLIHVFIEHRPLSYEGDRPSIALTGKLYIAPGRRHSDSVVPQIVNILQIAETIFRLWNSPLCGIDHRFNCLRNLLVSYLNTTYSVTVHLNTVTIYLNGLNAIVTTWPRRRRSLVIIYVGLCRRLYWMLVS